MIQSPQRTDAVEIGESLPGLREVRFEYTRDFPGILQHLNAALLVSTYQAGKLIVIGTHAGQLTFAFHDFERVMGVAACAGRLAVGTRRQVFFLRAAHEFGPRIETAGTYDGCWLARNSFVTGSIHGHDLAWGEDGLWAVNTLFSCLCTFDDQFNFVPRWRPPFVSTLIDQDRCHLNGLAMESGQPRYVTVLAESDEPAGWRPTKTTSGAVLDVRTGEAVVRGLSMPHSPRLHAGRLWVLDSGRGWLTRVDTQGGQVEVVAALPGYTRGLACHGPYAFVGLSKIRETAVFGGLPIGEHPDQLRCGVGVIELSSGRTIATLQFHSGVEEIFAVEVLPGTRNPKLCGPSLTEESDREIWIVPAESGEALHPPLAAKSATSATDGYQPEPPAKELPSPSPTIQASIPAELPRRADTRSASLVREGVAAHEQGRLVEALTYLRRAAECAPGSAEVLNHLGNLYQDLRDQPAALACYRQAVAVQPDYAPAHQNLGMLCSAASDPHQALHHFEQAQRCRPQAMNLVLGATVLPVVYDSVEQVGTWRKRLVDRVRALVDGGVAIDTTETTIPTSFYFAYQGENDRGVMQDLARVYRGVECCAAAREGGWRPGGPRIRVGFLSAHFCDHTIGRLNLGRIQRLSRREFEVTVISLRAPGDPTARAFQQAADRYVQTPRGPAAARRMIADLQLDVLVFTDVGMDALTQTLAYSRMAPIQAATWGHPDTTGSPAIDYYVSSELAETGDADAHYTEELVRLSNMGVCYARPLLSGPPRNREFFGLHPDRRIYLCPQTSFKFHPEFDDVLRGILEADPGGDLVVLEGRVPAWTAALRQRWERTLPDVQHRVRFIAAQPHADFLKLLAHADVMLDPFPFCGGNTTYEALAVRLATEEDLRQEVRQAIAGTCDVLFDNDQDVTAWEDILRHWTGRSP